jgi:hypothetical protein
MIKSQSRHSDRAVWTNRSAIPFACLLRDPLNVGVGRATSQMNATGVDLDEEQHIQPLEPDGVDREEIHGGETRGLRVQELTPGGTLALASGTELFLAQDLPDRGGRYGNAEALQLAHNALIAPLWVLPCQANDQRSTLQPTGTEGKQAAGYAGGQCRRGTGPRLLPLWKGRYSTSLN